MDHRFAVVIVALAVALLGCASEGGDTERGQGERGASATGRFVLTIVANGSTQNASLRVIGAFDDARHHVSLVTDLSGFVSGLDGRMAMVATPDAVFVDCPYLTRLLGAPTKWIKVADAAGASIVDPLRLLDLVRSLVRSATSGPDGLVRQTTMRFADGSEESERGSALVSVEYFDVGAPVVIEPPAAGEVTDETDAVKRLFGGTTGG